jgi:hypothetical protein
MHLRPAATRVALASFVLAAMILMAVTLMAPAVCRAAPSLPVAGHTHLAHAGVVDLPAATYGRGSYLFSSVRFRGSALAGNSVLSVADLETLALDHDFGMGYANRYSLMTSGSEFGVERFEGLRLADLLLYLGLDPAAPDSTPVRVVAADGYSTQFTLSQIRESGRYACYAAKDDATVLEANVPVLLSFASNGLPLVGPTGDDPVTREFTAADGYDETADNIGGPIRLTVGQTSSDDFNARFNAKWVTTIIVGDDTEPVHAGETAGLASSELTVRVFDTTQQADPLKTTTFSAGAVESWSSSLMSRGFYDDGAGAYYEGADLWQLLAQKVGLPGYEGTATVAAAGGERATVDLAYLRNLGRDHSSYAAERTVTPAGGLSTSVSVTGLHPLLAFAKNGAPMVAAAGDAGYRATGPAGAVVDNDGGPLAVLLPSDGDLVEEAVFLGGVTRIDVDVRVPRDLHVGDVYGSLVGNRIELGGAGIKSPGALSVADLERRADLMVTHAYGDLSVDGSSDDVPVGATGTYHGVDLLQLLRSSFAGLAVDAGTVTVSGTGGEDVSFAVDDLEAADEPVLLAFSREGVPLVESASSPGYEAAADNQGGPLALVSGGWTVSGVTAVTVSLQAGLWTHATPPYAASLGRTLTISGSEVAATTVLTLGDLEELASVRDSFAASKGVGAYQGVALKDLIVGRLATGVADPTRVRVFGADGYSVDLSVGDLLGGIDSAYQPGQHRDIILAYAKNGYPLVADASSKGYVEDAYNDGGPVHLVVENAISSWVKDVRAIVVGEGDPVIAPDRVAARSVRIVSPTAGRRVAYVARGAKLRLRADLMPSASNDTVTWASRDAARAAVTETGVVTARRLGRVRISVRTGSGRVDAVTLVVTRPRPVIAVDLPVRRTLVLGRAAMLTARLAPARATSLLRWHSSHAGVAAVDAGGRVVARRAGTTVITVRTASGVRAACRIVVRRQPGG